MPWYEFDQTWCEIRTSAIIILWFKEVVCLKFWNTSIAYILICSQWLPSYCIAKVRKLWIELCQLKIICSIRFYMQRSPQYMVLALNRLLWWHLKSNFKITYLNGWKLLWMNRISFYDVKVGRIQYKVNLLWAKWIFVCKWIWIYSRQFDSSLLIGWTV
jgi:hypothetical protein